MVTVSLTLSDSSWHGFQGCSIFRYKICQNGAR